MQPDVTEDAFADTSTNTNADGTEDASEFAELTVSENATVEEENVLLDV